MKLSKIIENVKNHNNAASCTLELQEDKSWKATYLYFNGKENLTSTKNYKAISSDIDLSISDRFQLFSSTWKNGKYVRNTTNGTYYISKKPLKYVNFYFS